jgi:protein TonB
MRGARRERSPVPPRIDEPPQLAPVDSGATGIPVIDGSPGKVTPPQAYRVLNSGLANGDLMAIVTVAPNYPPSAEARGLEGYVIVEFRVTANGSVLRHSATHRKLPVLNCR